MSLRTNFCLFRHLSSLRIDLILVPLPTQTIEDIDLYTGGLAEVPSKGAVVGPTFACLIGRQMFYYKSGDRYWYENDIPPSSFSKEQLNEIRKTTLARVVCDNIKTVDFIQPNVFIESDPFLNALMPCDGNTVIAVRRATHHLNEGRNRSTLKNQPLIL